MQARLLGGGRQKPYTLDYGAYTCVSPSSLTVFYRFFFNLPHSYRLMVLEMPSCTFLSCFPLPTLASTARNTGGSVRARPEGRKCMQTNLPWYAHASQFIYPVGCTRLITYLQLVCHVPLYG